MGQKFWLDGVGMLPWCYSSERQMLPAFTFLPVAR